MLIPTRRASKVTLSGAGAADKVVTLAGNSHGHLHRDLPRVSVNFTDGTLTATAVVTDQAEQHTADAENDGITLDTTADSAPGLTVTVDSVINDAESGRSRSSWLGWIPISNSFAVDLQGRGYTNRAGRTVRGRHA